MSGLSGFNGHVQRLEEKAPRPPAPVDDLGRMSDEELTQYSLHLRLDKAERLGDLEAAAKWRRCLTQDKEMLVEQFLNIDELSIPHAESGQVPRVKEGHIIYSLSRVMYRHERASIERHRASLRIDDYETMFRWLDAFGG